MDEERATDRVRRLLEFHAKKSFGTQANLRMQQAEARRIYKALESDEIAELARTAIAGAEARDILLCLACFRPGSLQPFHDQLIDRGIIYPNVLFHGAPADISRRVLSAVKPSIGRSVLDALTGDPRVRLNHLLLVLAWIGDQTVQSAFAEWRRKPPSWSGHLNVKPHEYAHEAGWELSADGSRRDLYSHFAIPLVRSGDPLAVEGPMTFASPCSESCGWCGQPLTALLDLDLTNPALQPFQFSGTRWRMATCLFCACYTPIYTRVDSCGAAAWSEANERPNYLPAPAPSDGLPSGALLLASQPRHFLESASWLLPGVSYSQIGGCPTWIQGAEFPTCPSCSQKMPFVGQISIEDCDEYGEGIYYTFRCHTCGVAASIYQQS